jgi:hypothetical protein
MDERKADPAFVQPDWGHVFAAYLAGCRDARANPEAGEEVFRRSADAHTKRVFEHVDPYAEQFLREERWDKLKFPDIDPEQAARTGEEMRRRLRLSTSSVDHRQRRGAFVDIIDEAISTYTQYMLDDDYNAQGCLDQIIRRMRERRAMYEERVADSQRSEPTPSGDATLLPNESDRRAP